MTAGHTVAEAVLEVHRLVYLPASAAMMCAHLGRNHSQQHEVPTQHVPGVPPEQQPVASHFLQETWLWIVGFCLCCHCWCHAGAGVYQAAQCVMRLALAVWVPVDCPVGSAVAAWRVLLLLLRPAAVS